MHPAGDDLLAAARAAINEQLPDGIAADEKANRLQTLQQLGMRGDVLGKLEFIWLTVAPPWLESRRTRLKQLTLALPVQLRHKLHEALRPTGLPCAARSADAL